jgi:RimJ/RimL family protein N-acetyltransferase
MHVKLTTDRLLLRRMTAGDEDNLVELDSDAEVMKYLTNGRPTPREEIRDEVLPRLVRQYAMWPHYGLWAAVVRQTGEFTGWFAMRPDADHPEDEPELGYRLRRSAWGRGYATEGSLALIDDAFTVAGAATVRAETMFVNAGSRRVMERCGLRHVGTRHDEWADPIPGTELGEVEYAIDRAEWLARRTPDRGRHGHVA